MAQLSGSKSKKPSGSRLGLTRGAILSAAKDIITQQGIENLSMRKIAAKLGCSVAGPYSHFANQDEILRALLKEGEAQLTRDLRQALAKSNDVYEQLSQIAHTYFLFSRENRELHKLMFSISGHKRLFFLISSSYRVYLETLRKGVKSGAIRYSRKGYHAVARTMWAWIYGLLVLDLTGLLQHTKPEIDRVEEGILLFRKLLQQGE